MTLWDRQGLAVEAQYRTLSCKLPLNRWSLGPG